MISSQLFGKLIGIGKKNGIKVYEQFGKKGERILSSFKPGKSEPFKQVIRYKDTVNNNAYHRSGNLFNLNIVDRHLIVKQTGKNPIDIRTSIDHWFYQGEPLKTYTSGLKVQKENPDIAWIKNIYHIDTTHPNSVSVFENDVMKAHKFL